MNGKRYVLVKFTGNQELAAPSGSKIVFTTYYDHLFSEKLRLNKVVLRFDKAQDAARYCRQYNCQRFLLEGDAIDQADYYPKEEVEQHFGFKDLC